MSPLFYENVRSWDSRDDFRLWVLEGNVRKPYRHHQMTIIFEKELEIWKLDGSDRGDRMFFCGKYSTYTQLERALLFIHPVTIDAPGKDINDAMDLEIKECGPFIFD